MVVPSTLEISNAGVRCRGNRSAVVGGPCACKPHLERALGQDLSNVRRKVILGMWETPIGAGIWPETWRPWGWQRLHKSESTVTLAAGPQFIFFEGLVS